MIIPPSLKPGDKIGVVAPARRIDQNTLGKAVEIVRMWGLEVHIGHSLSVDSQGYLSGPDEVRLAELQQMIDNPDIKAILCARGGYGSTRIVDLIDFEPLKKTPKWLIGFSDVTALHLALWKHNICSMHATMPVLFPLEESQRSVQSIRDLLFGVTDSISIQGIDDNRTGRCRGPMIGGNLSLIADSIGTRTEPKTDGTILVIEEIDEYFYKVDRMMTQLKRSGKLKRLAGLVIGHMTSIKNGELVFSHSVNEIILDAVKEFDYPVAFGFPSGHENPNLAWRHGFETNLEVAKDFARLDFAPFKASN